MFKQQIPHAINFLRCRKDFPILQKNNRDRALVYLDSASSSQKPSQVIDAMNSFYFNDYANIHRGIYELSERASQLYENARNAVKEFIHAKEANEIVFVKGTTEGINLVASSLGENFKAQDEIILSEMEHHSNIVPWLFLKKKLGVVIKVVPVKEDGSLDMAIYPTLFL